MLLEDEAREPSLCDVECANFVVRGYRDCWFWESRVVSSQMSVRLSCSHLRIFEESCCAVDFPVIDLLGWYQNEFRLLYKAQAVDQLLSCCNFIAEISYRNTRPKPIHSIVKSRLKHLSSVTQQDGTVNHSHGKLARCQAHIAQPHP